MTFLIGIGVGFLLWLIVTSSVLVAEDFRSNQITWGVLGSNVGLVPGKARNISDPMELAMDGGKAYFVERFGGLKSFDKESKQFTLVNQFEVFTGFEDGLLGLTLDPGFATNHWMYLFRSMPKSTLDDSRRKCGMARVARFKVVGDKLDVSSEEVILEVQTQRELSRHSAGSLCFDGDSNLLVALGDNTEWSEALGYSPIDERLGKEFLDAQRTASNANSLLGKILRLHPKSGGGYEIPKGNLFAEGAPGTRSEIFAMGVRNPFRISWDRGARQLWWSDLGPDAAVSAKERGPAGYDEINCSKRGGFFGWPYFVADNKPYRHLDFATRIGGEPWSVTEPENRSPNNSGLTRLPPAQPASLFYGHLPSTRWPQVNGAISTSSIIGPVYHFDPHLDSDLKLPKSLDNCVFIADWVRNWLLAAKLDEQGNLPSGTNSSALLFPILEPNKLIKPIDLELGSDGALYILEYGSHWMSGPDARISRITGNQNLKHME